MKPTRRDFLKQAGAVTISGVVIGCGDSGSVEADAAVVAQPPRGDPGTDTGADTPLEPDDLEDYQYDGDPGPETLFQHGVASGDPLADAVIIWTRASVGADKAAESVDVWWEIAVDKDFIQRVAVGTATTGPDADHTVKIDVTGLNAGRTYYYQFKSLGRTSPVGRTRTTADGPLDRLRLGVCSCAKYTSGYFHAYRYLAEQPDLDAVLHLGDYIYESNVEGFTAGRDHLPPYEPVSLDDYRARYANYRTDLDLQEAHRQHPFIAIWDDHETTNNSWKDGASNHDPPGEGTWVDRKAAAIQAYFEWLPIRDTDDRHIFRTFKFGDLVDLVMLDTRLYGRDEQTKDPIEMADPARTLLGFEQEKWLDDQLAESAATWRVLGQQVVMTPLTAGGEVLNNDQWDGYQAARDRLLDSLDALAADNVVVLTGDIHSSWAGEVPRDAADYDPETGDGARLIELVTPGITSGFPLQEGLVDLAKELNPHIKYGEVTRRGYMVVDVTPERMQAAWYHMASVTEETTTQSVDAAWSTALGSVRLVQDDATVEPPSDVPDPAP